MSLGWSCELSPAQQPDKSFRADKLTRFLPSARDRNREHLSVHFSAITQHKFLQERWVLLTTNWVQLEDLQGTEKVKKALSK